MTNEKGRGISPFSFYSLLFISRIFGLLTFPNDGTPTLSAFNGNLIALTYIPLTILFSLPVLFLRRKTGCSGRYRIGETHPAAAGAIFVSYACFFLLQAALCAMMLDSFSGTAMFRHGGHPWLMLLFFIFSLLTASTGMETAARAAPPVLLFFFLTVCLLSAATLPYFEPENLQRASNVSVSLLLRNGLFAALRTAEPAGLVFYASNRKKGGQYGLPITISLIGMTVSLLFTLICGVTGAFGETQRFQFYTLTTVAELGTVERMDDLLSVLWVFCAMLKTVFYLTLAIDGFRYAGIRLQTKGGFLFLLAAAWGSYLLLIKADAVRRFFTDSAGNMLLVFLFTALLPSVLLCAESQRKRKGKKNNEAA